MTEAELQMMDTIHLYGQIYALNDAAQRYALSRLRELLRDGQQGPEAAVRP